MQKDRQMSQINAYLTFDGNCREGMSFYRDCFGGELTLQTIEGSPMEDQFPITARNRILHGSLVNDRLVLLGSDLGSHGSLVKGNTISLSLNCSSEEEINIFFAKLSYGGQVVHPLHQFFAGTMGTITDKFEKDWLLYYEKKPNLKANT
jgi:PhnB protein